MKRIIINGRFLTHRITGVERYAREILSELDTMISPGEFVLAVPPNTGVIPVYKNIEVMRIGKFQNYLWEHVSFPIFVKIKRGISLNLCNTAPFISPGVVTIFDMKIRQHPEFFSRKFVAVYRFLFRNETLRAKLIFTDSYSAKDDIIKYYNVREDRIVVTHCAWQHFNRIGFDEHAVRKYGLENDGYYFALGSFDPNKNFGWIAEVASKNPNMIFAVAGTVNKTVFSAKFGFECPDNLKLLGYITDEEAKTLMKRCKAFLFPSFCEGFGMPPLEAMSAGAKHIVVSDIPVMHEVFGDTVQYINPKIRKMVEIGDKKVDFSEVLERFSWRESALIMLNALRERIV